MIDVRLYDGSGHARALAPGDISEHVDPGGSVIWVDLADPSPEELECVRGEFDLHPLALEDAIKHGQRPKLESYPSHAFVVAYAGNLAEVDIFLGPGWLVTVGAKGTDGVPWDSGPARQRFERSGPAEATSGFLLYMVLDTIVDEYFTWAERAEAKVEALEDEIFTAERGSEADLQGRLYAMRRELLLFRRRVQPLREVVAAILRKEIPWVDDVARTHFQDVFDHVLRATDQLDGQRELLGNAVDAHLALISNRMNEVMKTMTSWGAILLGSTLIAGVYGMNFEHMPELGWEYGYPFALGLMALLTGCGWAYFRRKDWL